MIQSKSNSIVLFLCTSLRATTSEQTTSNENEIYEMHGGQCGGCIFPFIFQGRYHDSCTIIDGDSPWCSTVENLDEAEAGGGNWRYCEENTCPGISRATTPQMTVNSKNARGKCYCGVPNYHKQRIVGGNHLAVGVYPWQVAILYNGKMLFRQGCGGTLVSDRHVITAAHCTYGKRKSDLFVRVGDTSFDTKKEVSNARTLGVKKIFNHPKYDDSTLQHDIAILVLSRRLPLRKFPNIKPACLPALKAKFSGPGFISGWGRDQSGGIGNSWLHGAEVEIFRDGNCGSMKNQMTNDMICAGYKEGGIDTCQGDSGGPLTVQDPANNGWMTLVGVVSWGHGCADPDSLGIYSEVSHNLKWLKKKMKPFRTCPAYSDDK